MSLREKIQIALMLLVVIAVIVLVILGILMQIENRYYLERHQEEIAQSQ